MSSEKKLNVFVSYSHQDKAWLERVQVHLKPQARDGKLDLWDDTGSGAASAGATRLGPRSHEPTSPFC